MEITRESKLLEVLEAYPFLESQIMNIAPPFRNLKNPILRRTVGKLTTLEKVAQVGGLDINNLVNTLRRAVGQDELIASSAANLPSIDIPQSADDPDWVSGQPQFTINGTELLQHGEVPLAKVNEMLEVLDADKYLLLITDFEPTPIVEAMQKQHRHVFHKLIDDGQQHLTFIC